MSEQRKLRICPSCGEEYSSFTCDLCHVPTVSTGSKDDRVIPAWMWEPFTNDKGEPLICSICGDPIPRIDNGWHGDCEGSVFQHTDCSYQRQIKELQDKLAVAMNDKTPQKLQEAAAGQKQRESDQPEQVLRDIISDTLWKHYDEAVDKAASVGVFKMLRNAEAAIGREFIKAALSRQPASKEQGTT